MKCEPEFKFAYWHCENCNAPLKITVIPAAGVCWESCCPKCKESFKIERGIITDVEQLPNNDIWRNEHE